MTYAKQNLSSIRTTISRNLKLAHKGRRTAMINAYRLMFPEAFAKFPIDQFARREKIARQGNWYPACGGTEVPFVTRNGYRLLYCWQPSSGRHAYLNVETDIIMSDDEARASLGTF